LLLRGTCPTGFSGFSIFFGLTIQAFLKKEDERVDETHARLCWFLAKGWERSREKRSEEEEKGTRQIDKFPVPA